MFIMAALSPSRTKGSIALILIVIVLVYAVNGQLLLTGISISNSTILAPSTYTFSFSRFSPQHIPNNSLLLLTFAGQYGQQIAAAPPCTTSGLSGANASCAFSGTLLYVTQIFTTAAALSSSSFTLSVSNIINPSPAGSYTPLISVAILTPAAATFESGTSSATVTIASGIATCTAAISNAFVSKNGQISVTYASSYISTADATNHDLFVSIPTSYPEDLTATPVDPSLSINATLSLYPGTYLFQTAFATAFTITLLMPPSTKPENNFIIIYSQTNRGTIGGIDSCSITISGMQPSNFSSIDISKEIVQRSSTLLFDLSLSTSLHPSDTLAIVFPSAFGLSGVGNTVSISGFGTMALTRFDNNLLISSISSQPVLYARLIFGIAGIAMPFNTLPYTLTLTLGTAGNYSRIVQNYAYSAAAGSLSVTLSCLNAEIGTVLTRCLFSFSTESQIASSGTINIMFPSQFTIASGSSPCSLTGSGLYSTLDCLYTASNNTITAGSITPSTNNILPIAVSLNVTVNMSQHVGNYSLAVSTQSLGATVDLGYASLTTTTRTLKSNQFSVTSSSTVTNSATTYTALFSLPFDLGVTYTVTLSLPFTVQNGLSLALNGGNPVSFNNGTLTFTANQLTNNASFSIGNLLTPSSLQPATIAVRVMYNSLPYFSGTASLTMTQLRQFSIATLVPSSQVVHAHNIATVTLSGLSNGDKIVLNAYAGFYQNSQQNCSSNVVSCGLAGVLTVLNASNPTVFTINIQNLGFVGSSQVNITSYDSTQSFAKLSSLVTIAATTPNVITIIANQTNPYLNQPSVYTFSLQFNTPNANTLLITPAGMLATSATCILNCGSPTILPLGYLFPIASTNCIVTFTLTNPTAFSNSVKLVFKTSNAQGDIDYGEFVPQAACASPCRSCWTNGGNVCLTCYSWSAQTILYNGTCISVCPNGFFQTLSSAIAVCSPCLSLCTFCSGTASNCSACQVGTYLFNLGCYQSCPLGTYTSSSNVCVSCIQANCSVCNETTCSVCFSGSLLYNGTCLTSCPPLFYSNSGACVSCASNCLVCSPTNGSCSSCASPNLLYGGSCSLSCPSGLFQQQSNHICEICRSPCASCSITSTNCTSCLRIFNQTNYFYFQNQCLSQCIDRYYGDATSALCLQCPLGCATCTSAACLTCNSGFLLYQGKCYSQCPPGTFQNSSACLACSSICAACLSPSVCTSCIASYHLFNSTCSPSCPDFFYSSSGTCLPCVFPCKLCNSLGCNTCVSGYYLQQTTCTTSCTGIFRPNNQTMACQACQRPCSGCTWSNACTSCLSGHSLLDTSCLASCPNGYYSNGAQCISCPSNCTSCTFLNNQPACTACANSLLLYSFTCIASCPSGSQKANGFCISEDCSALRHCAVCAGSQCTQCSSLFQMDASYTCSQTVAGSAVANALMGIPVPFPFLIAILMVMVIAFLLKHNFPKMFSPLFIYSIAGCFEFLCLALWTLLSVFWNLGLQQPLSYANVVYATVLIGSTYVILNIAQFVLWNKRIQADRQYRLWEKQDNRCASLSIAIVSLFFSFRLDALKFSKTGHNPHLSARLSSPQMFKHYSILALISLLLSGVSILVSVYISYMQTSLNYLFFTGIEVAVIAIIMIVLSVAMLCVSRAQLLEDKSEYQVGYDHDQLEGKSVEELLNGLGIVEQHHEHNHYQDSGNAVLVKNDHSSQHHSQDLTLMEPVAQLSFQEQDDSQAELHSRTQAELHSRTQAELHSRTRKETQPQALQEEEGESDEIFGEAIEVSSDNHILIDGFQRDKKEALELSNRYGLAEKPVNSTYPRQTGAILKQRLPELKDDSEIESAGSFEQFTVDITRGKWKKQNPAKLSEEEEHAQGQDVEELQIRQIIEEKIKLEQAQRTRQQQQLKRMKEMQQFLMRKEIQQRQKWQLQQKRQQWLKKRVQQLKMQQKAKQQQRIKQEAFAEQQRVEQQQRKKEQLQLHKKRKAQERLHKIQMQKKRQQEWKVKKQQARLKKLQEERLLMQRMQHLRKEQQGLRQRMKQESAKQKARLQQERKIQMQRNKRELDKISKLKAELQLLQGIQQQFHAKNEQLEQQQRELQFKQKEKQKEAKERGQMAVEDRLSRMATVFEQMWKKAAQISQKPQRKIRNQQQKQVKTQKQSINYQNSDENIVSQLSPRKIRVNPRPHPSQYTRRHLFVEEGTEILSQSESSPQLSQQQLQIIYQGGQAYETIRSAPHKQMPKEDSDDPVAMVFQDKIAEVLQEQQGQQKGQSICSHPSKLQAKIKQQADAIDIQYIGRSIHSGSSETHWPIEPQMQERIQEVQRRADWYINQPKRKQTQRYLYETPDNRIYEEQQDGETQLGEIVFEESDHMLQSESLKTGPSHSVGKSSGRRKYPSGRVNRMVIDLSPDK